MAVLNDTRITRMARAGDLKLENFVGENVTPNGYDITIGSVRTQESPECESVEVTPAAPFWVSSLEVFNLPPGIGGQIFIRSSYARKGVIGSFGYVDAGFRGSLTLAFFNASSNIIRVQKGSTIAQIIFMELDSPADMLYGERSGHYQGKTGINL